MNRPRMAATAVLVGGLGASLAGNLQAINLGDASPGAGAYASALFWPLALFGVIEVLLHTPWRSTWRDWLTKATGIVAVGFVAAWVSYWHLAHVLDAYGYDAVASHVGPLAIDVGMAMATLALNRVGLAIGQPAEPLAKPELATPVATGQTLEEVGQLANLDSMDDLAIGQAGLELASEVERYVATGQLAKPDVATGQLAKPDVATGHVAKPVAKEVAKEVASGHVARELAIPAVARGVILSWLASGQSWPSAGQLDASLADEFQVSPRTARRWRVQVIAEQTKEK